MSVAYTSDPTTHVLNSCLEDHSANIIFLAVGKKNISGLSNFDHIIKNDNKHGYARIALCKFIETGDDSILVYMNETMTVATIASTDYGNSGADKMKSFKIHFEARGKAGRVLPETAKCTLTDCNCVEDSDNVPEVIITEDQYINSDNEKKYGVGIWVNIYDMEYVLVNVDRSIAANSTPINNKCYPSTYSVEYISDKLKEPDVNLINVVDILAAREICRGDNSETYLNARLEKVEEKTKYEPNQFIMNTVAYTPTYEPKSTGVEDTVQVTSIDGPVPDRIIILDHVNNTFSVQKPGIYMLQLRNGFYLVQGESRMDLRVYKNAQQLKEMGISCYLTSNEDGKGDKRKAIKNLYSSNAMILKLTPQDKIKLTATWMDIDNIKVENETMISITALQYNIT